MRGKKLLVVAAIVLAMAAAGTFAATASADPVPSLPTVSQAAPAAAPAVNAVTMPCAPTVRACVIMRSTGFGTAMLVNNGVPYQAVEMSAGAPSPETATPTGIFSVKRKVKDDWSKEFNAPMKNSVYFTNQGHAFHQGRVDWLSHGCVHLEPANAEAFFNYLQVGDSVQIVQQG
ncbi:murein L,D-transpeptidase [Pseudonocardiaceae bacterium YIM PH 21723]|nr:murein L,D-transpeptidase [Pseudonocardiaceae bacterium YIM PH 21723]